MISEFIPEGGTEGANRAALGLLNGKKVWYE